VVLVISAVHGAESNRATPTVVSYQTAEQSRHRSVSPAGVTVTYSYCSESHLGHLHSIVPLRVGVRFVAMLANDSLLVSDPTVPDVSVRAAAVVTCHRSSTYTTYTPTIIKLWVCYSTQTK